MGEGLATDALLDKLSAVLINAVDEALAPLLPEIRPDHCVVVLVEVAAAIIGKCCGAAQQVYPGTSAVTVSRIVMDHLAKSVKQVAAKRDIAGAEPVSRA